MHPAGVMKKRKRDGRPELPPSYENPCSCFTVPVWKSITDEQRLSLVSFVNEILDLKKLGTYMYPVGRGGSQDRLLINLSNLKSALLPPGSRKGSSRTCKLDTFANEKYRRVVEEMVYAAVDLIELRNDFAEQLQTLSPSERADIVGDEYFPGHPFDPEPNTTGYAYFPQRPLDPLGNLHVYVSVTAPDAEAQPFHQDNKGERYLTIIVPITRHPDQGNTEVDDGPVHFTASNDQLLAMTGDCWHRGTKNGKERRICLVIVICGGLDVQMRGPGDNDNVPYCTVAQVTDYAD